MAIGKKLTKEELLLLEDFSRNVSTKSSALFYGNAFIVSAVPICEYQSIQCLTNSINATILSSHSLTIHPNNLSNRALLEDPSDGTP